jgi:hypothetical protein
MLMLEYKVVHSWSELSADYTPQVMIYRHLPARPLYSDQVTLGRHKSVRPQDR